MKNPVTPPGIEPATFRFVAQNLNHCATAVPILMNSKIKLIWVVTSYRNPSRQPHFYRPLESVSISRILHFANL